MTNQSKRSPRSINEIVSYPSCTHNQNREELSTIDNIEKTNRKREIPEKELQMLFGKLNCTIETIIGGRKLACRHTHKKPMSLKRFSMNNRNVGIISKRFFPHICIHEHPGRKCITPKHSSTLCCPKLCQRKSVLLIETQSKQKKCLENCQIRKSIFMSYIPFLRIFFAPFLVQKTSSTRLILL